MRLYVLRHAIAEDAAPGQADADRKLTEPGVRKLRRVLERAAHAGAKPDAILTSPYVRARHTAEIAAQELGFPGPLIETTNLLPFADVVDAWEELREYAKLDSALVVGHNPQLSYLVAMTIGAPGYGIEMKKGALAAIDLTSTGKQPRGTLLWLLTAKSAG